MTDAPFPHDPDFDPQSSEHGIEIVEERLRRERPVPNAGFRGELRSRLMVTAGRGSGRVRALIAAYSTSGFALIALATLGVAGVGPLSA